MTQIYILLISRRHCAGQVLSYSSPLRLLLTILLLASLAMPGSLWSMCVLMATLSSLHGKLPGPTKWSLPLHVFPRGTPPTSLYLGPSAGLGSESPAFLSPPTEEEWMNQLLTDQSENEGEERYRS